MAGLLACLAGAAGAWFMATSAHRLGLIERPNERSSHTRPIPRGCDRAVDRTPHL